MKQMVMVVDQTVNEALRLGTPMASIELMIPLLRKYSIETVDVSLHHLQKAGVSLEQSLLLPLLRCKIHSSLEEIAEARQMGFRKIIITWRHQPLYPSLDQLANALAAVQEFAQEVYVCIENAAEVSTSELTLYWSLLVRYQV